MPVTRVNGIDLHWELHGPEDGEPARRHRVLAYDMRGQGQSEHPEGECSFDQHADDLPALMDAVGHDRALARRGRGRRSSGAQ